MALEPLTRLRALHLLGPVLDGNEVELDDGTWRALETAYYRNLARSLRVRADIRRAVLTLDSVDISPAPLKGALHVLEDTFTHPAARALADIDLLVSASEFPRALSALEAAGYRGVKVPGFTSHHEVPMPADERGVVVELHREIGTPTVACLLSGTEYLERSTFVEHEGLQYRSPVPAHVVLHNVVHAQVADLNHAVFGLPLRQLHTLCAYVRRRGESVDWDEVVNTMRVRGKLLVLAGYLDLARTIFGWGPGAAVELPCPQWRRTLCMVNAATGGGVGDLLRNVDNAFASEYLRARYGDRPLPRLWLLHARTLWGQRGAATLKEAAGRSRWR